MLKSGSDRCVVAHFGPEPFLAISRETTRESSRARVVLRLINQEGLPAGWRSLPDSARAMVLAAADLGGR